jgi:phosphoribosylformylglycinamidine synthase subunit PurQ / glutaminase
VKFGVVVFPGSNCDKDCVHVLKEVFGQEVIELWHKERDIANCDCIVLPGGFSYGDYLRTGAIARFSPIMEAVADHANKGKPVIGICNGFQILCESGLLPGALIRNRSLRFICKTIHLKVENSKTSFTQFSKKILTVPIAHGEGNYFTHEDELKSLQDNEQIIFKYCSENGEVSKEYNPNGSLLNIAGIINKKGNILGMMPHPERCSENELGGTDGRLIFESIINNFQV